MDNAVQMTSHCQAVTAFISVCGVERWAIYLLEAECSSCLENRFVFSSL